MRCGVIALGGALLCLLAPAAAGDELMDVLVPRDAFDQYRYGVAVDVQGDRILVGSDGDSAQLFERVGSGWVYTNSLAGPGAVGGRACAVDMAADWIAVGGAPGSLAAGEVYVFESSGTSLSLHTVLHLGGGDTNDGFGESVAVDGQLLLVGAPRLGPDGPDHGGAIPYEFRSTDWYVGQPLDEDARTPNDGFGCGVDVDGGTLLVGAWADSEHFERSGAVHVYEYVYAGVSYRTAKLTSSRPEAHGLFGSSFDVDGDLIAVGAPGEGADGAVELFRRYGNGWLLEQRFEAPAGSVDSGYGEAVAVQADRLVVCAPGHSATPSRTYVYRPTLAGWELWAQFEAPGQEVGDRTGACVAIDDHLVVLGAPMEGHDGYSENGCAYALDLAELGSGTYCTAAPNSVSADGARIGARGSISVAQNDFVLTVTDAVPGRLGLFYYGPEPMSAPFGGGVRCVGGGGIGVFRLGPAQVAGFLGDAERRVDFTARPAGGGSGAILPGSTWFFQYYYRDPAAGIFNLSNALVCRFSL